MPIPIIGEIALLGIDAVPYAWTVIKVLPWVLAIYLVRWFFGGTSNSTDRVMHGRVVLVTGGTAGLGEAIVNDLAGKGCQIILLVRSIQDGWLHEYINDLRSRHSNELIYAEECDLSSLLSIRGFCTRWLDNSPPRRLDAVVLAAGVMNPPFTSRRDTIDGVESHWGINYLGNFHLLTLLEPALKVQPADRDVRVLVATCASYLLGDLDLNDPEFTTRGYPSKRPWKSYGASKLALMGFVSEFQRKIEAYVRPDKLPNNVRVFSVDPGIMRSPGTRRWISCGSILGLLGYLVTFPLWWLTLKNTEQGAQSFFAGLYNPDYAVGAGGLLLRECRPSPYRNFDVSSPALGEQLYEVAKVQIEFLEKQTALKKAKEKAAKAKEVKVETKEAKSKTTTATTTATPERAKVEKTAAKPAPTPSPAKSGKRSKKA